MKKQNFPFSDLGDVEFYRQVGFTKDDSLMIVNLGKGKVLVNAFEGYRSDLYKDMSFIFDTENTLVNVSKGNKKGILNKECNLITGKMYDKIRYNKKYDVIYFEDKKKCGAAKLDGTIITKGHDELQFGPYSGLIYVEDTGRKAYITFDGEVVSNRYYDDVSYDFMKDMIVAKSGSDIFFLPASMYRIKPC